jgi:hypothetical protein
VRLLHSFSVSPGLLALVAHQTGACGRPPHDLRSASGALSGLIDERTAHGAVRPISIRRQGPPAGCNNLDHLRKM